MANFLKSGNRIIPQQKGLEYDLINGKIYNLLIDNFGNSFFEEDGSLNLKFKEYNTKEDDIFRNRVLKYHKNSTKQTTGVLLYGEKGTGKTVMAKQIARDSGLPIIIVSPNYPTKYIQEFFSKFDTDLVLIFDEIDKECNRWRTDDLLGFLDGVQTTSKKLVILTCNTINGISEYLNDRCSRIRYKRKFNTTQNEKFLKSLIADRGIKDEDNSLYNFILKSFSILSIDNILSFLDEKVMFPDLSNEELIADMNISCKSIDKDENKSKLPKLIDNTNEDYECDKDDCDCNEDDYYIKPIVIDKCINQI